jgi:DNA-binding XRE family transcriptional regulator
VKNPLLSWSYLVLCDTYDIDGTPIPTNTRFAAAEIFQTNQTQQLRNAGVLIKSYRDYTSPGNPSMTQAELAAEAGTTQPVVSNLERGKEVPNDTVLANILTAVRLPPTCPEGKAVYDTLRTIRDTQDAVKQLPKHKP